LQGGEDVWEVEMRRVIFWGFIVLTAAIVSAQQSDIDRKQMKWIDGVLRRIATIKPGMLRKDLSSVFTTEGGISTRTQRTYVYRQCPYIKVTVDFEPTTDPSTDFEQRANDRIIQISQPFLQYSLMD
jgi:hypothetical protein